MATTSEANALGYNLDVDFVVCYSFNGVGKYPVLLLRWLWTKANSFRRSVGRD